MKYVNVFTVEILFVEFLFRIYFIWYYLTFVTNVKKGIFAFL